MDNFTGQTTARFWSILQPAVWNIFGRAVFSRHSQACKNIHPVDQVQTSYPVIWSYKPSSIWLTMDNFTGQTTARLWSILQPVVRNIFGGAVFSRLSHACKYIHPVDQVQTSYPVIW